VVAVQAENVEEVACPNVDRLWGVEYEKIANL